MGKRQRIRRARRAARAFKKWQITKHLLQWLITPLQVEAGLTVRPLHLLQNP